MTPGRRYGTVIVVLLGGSAALLVSYAATWAVAVVPVFAGASVTQGPGRELVLAGRDLAPLGAAMGWVGLAAVAALLATKTWGRRVTGAVVLLAGGIAGVTGLAFGLSEIASGGGGAFVEAALGARTDAAAESVSTTAWWVVATGAGLAVMASGLLAVVDGPSWPRLGARYSRDSAAVSTRGAAATWDALDRGEDPTIEGADPTGGDALWDAGDVPGSMESAEPHGPGGPPAEEER